MATGGSAAVTVAAGDSSLSFPISLRIGPYRRLVMMGWDIDGGRAGTMAIDIEGAGSAQQSRAEVCECRTGLSLTAPVLRG